LDKNSPVHYITIPEDYTYANIKMESILDFSSPILGGNPDLEGQRSYTYFGIDANNDGNMVDDQNSPEDKIHFFLPSLAYDSIRDSGGRATQGYGYTEQPIYHSTGEKMISIVATLHDMGEAGGTPLVPSAPYSITITVEKLEGPNYPMMHGLSGLASYLAAFRGGVVLAQEDFGIHGRGMQDLPDSGNPSQNEQLMDDNNKQVFYVKSKLNTLLAQVAGVEDDPLAIAQAYSSSNQTMFLGIVADTNMVPQFFFETTGQVSGQWQGFGVAGDTAYADIDMDLELAPYGVDDGLPSMELAVGRIVGWDAQDASALLGRTFFYERIIDQLPGLDGRPWKESALTSFGTNPPVGLALTVTEKLAAAFRQAGFYVDGRHDGPLSDSKLTAPLYARSSLVYFCAHGFFYWYVPPGFKPTGVGGGF
ncbi:MAG: hypothetical protein QCI38_08930, partial [Candidatus Thermoplasmatota archaeon]|nr:hypothetical protein [Candidatus Thermoplasmatota archaeon]